MGSGLVFKPPLQKCTIFISCTHLYLNLSRFRDSKTGTFLKGFPAPYWVHAFGFVFQAFVAYEVQRRWGQFAPPANFAYLASSMSKGMSKIFLVDVLGAWLQHAIKMPQINFDWPIFQNIGRFLSLQCRFCVLDDFGLMMILVFCGSNTGCIGHVFRHGYWSPSRRFRRSIQDIGAS